MTGASLPNPHADDIEEQTQAFDAYRLAFNRYHAHPTPLHYQAARVAMGRFLASFGIETVAARAPSDEAEPKRGQR